MATVLYTPPTASSSITVPNSGTTIPSGSVTVPSHSHSLYGMNNSNSTYITGNGNLTGSGLHVTSDAEFEGNIKWKGKDLGKMLETIEKRLAILEPNPKKLAKFEALQKAYDHYKLLEALCQDDE